MAGPMGPRPPMPSMPGMPLIPGMPGGIPGMPPHLQAFQGGSFTAGMPPNLPPGMPPGMPPVGSPHKGSFSGPPGMRPPMGMPYGPPIVSGAHGAIGQPPPHLAPPAKPEDDDDEDGDEGDLMALLTGPKTITTPAPSAPIPGLPGTLGLNPALSMPHHMAPPPGSYAMPYMPPHMAPGHAIPHLPESLEPAYSAGSASTHHEFDPHQPYDVTSGMVGQPNYQPPQEVGVLGNQDEFPSLQVRGALRSVLYTCMCMYGNVCRADMHVPLSSLRYARAVALVSAAVYVQLTRCQCCTSLCDWLLLGMCLCQQAHQLPCAMTACYVSLAAPCCVVDLLYSRLDMNT